MISALKLPAQVLVRRGHFIVILTVALSLLLASPYGVRAADFWISITVDPEQPSVNERVRVSVQTLRASSGCLTDPNVETTPFVAYDGINSVFPLDAFELRALAPDPVSPAPHGTPAAEEIDDIVFEATRSDRDPTVWEGDVVFPRPGEWTLRLTYPSFGMGDPACIGFEETVTVLPESGAGTPTVGTPPSATPEI